MSVNLISRPVRRRTLLKAGLAIGAMQVASPFVVKSLADEPVKIGLDNPLTGTYAALGKNELTGAQLALDQINAKNGILGRKVELLVEDSTSADAATAVQKANKLIERDKVNFLIGNINSGLAQAMANVSFEKKVFHIVPGGHTDSVTGSQCHWNVFRVCNTTRMETNSVSKLLLTSYGKKWYFITTDYAFGHSLQEGFEASLKANGGTELGADKVPLQSTDFSSYLIKAQSTNPDAIILSARRRRHDQLPEAGGAVRARQEVPHRRRAAGARSERGPAARSVARRLGVRMVLEATRCGAR